MPALLGRSCDMIFPVGRELRRCGLRCRPTLPTVKAGGASVLYRNWLTVNVRHRDDGDIVHRAVVKEPAVFPVAALVTDAIIAEAVIHPAIKSDMRPLGRPLSQAAPSVTSGIAVTKRAARRRP